MVVAGGMESMTNAPHLVRGMRKGVKFGDDTLVDSMAHDGLFCQFDQVAMGAATDRYNRETDAITREEQDEYSATSHERAAAAQKEGRFDAEIVEVSVPQPQGRPAGGVHRRGRPPRHVGGVPREAPAGVRRRRHHHGGVGVADLRRGRRAGGHVGVQGLGPGPGAAGRGREGRDGRGARTPRCRASRPTP